MAQAITDLAVSAGLAAVLKIDEGDLPDYYSALIGQAHLAAHQTIVGILLGRGFLREQIDGWDRLAEFELDLSLWNILVRTGAYQSMDPTAVRTLDRRAELAEVVVFVGGVWVRPASGQPGTATSSGPMATGAGAFTYDDSQPNMGFDW